MRPVRAVLLTLVVALGLGGGALAAEPNHCSGLLEGASFSIVTGPVAIPSKYRVVHEQRASFDHIDTHDLQRMLGQYGNKIEGALYEDAKTILCLSDGRDKDLIERMGPALAKEYPKKTVVSAELNVVQNGFVNNWGLFRIDNTERFPVKNNSFDRIVLRRGMCVCHEGRCCAGFKPASADARNFLGEVVRILNKNDPHAMAVLHGMVDVGMAEIFAWSAFLDEISKTAPIRYRMMMDHQGMFHSILIQPSIAPR